MDQSASFARHFARLLWLLLHEVSNVVEQKMSLRALVIVSKSGPVALVVREGQLFANDVVVPAPLTGVHEVQSQMEAHSIERIDVGATSSAADLLGLARILAGQAAKGDGGTQARQKLAALGPCDITFVTVPARAEEPTLVVSAKPEPAPAPAPAPSQRAAEDAAALVAHLVASDVTRLTPEELFARLDRTPSAEATARTLDDLVALAEHAARVAKAPMVAAIFHEIVLREKRLPDGEGKRAMGAIVKRLVKPALLRAVATLIPKRPEKKQHYFEILERAGEDGADALVDQITQATTTTDRKQLFEVFEELPDAIPALVRMLGDSRWFVVRNAAELLGELGAKQAEGALIQLLQHTDDRVRRAATNALMKIGTPDALKGIYEAVNDASPEVRMQAAAAIATRRDARTSNTLIRAIEDEQDADVQMALIAALGRVGTPDAIQKLVKMAEPEGRLFRKKDTSLRVAAVQALGEARTPAALNALRDLADDKDREVRETASRALAQVRT